MGELRDHSDVDVDGPLELDCKGNVICAKYTKASLNDEASCVAEAGVTTDFYRVRRCTGWQAGVGGRGGRGDTPGFAGLGTFVVVRYSR